MKKSKLILMSALMGASVLGSIAPVHAAYQIEKDKKGSITLYKYVSNDGKYKDGTFAQDPAINDVAQTPVAGVGFKYVKIGELVQVPSASPEKIGLYYALDTKFLEELAKYGITPTKVELNGGSYYTAETVNAALKKLTTTTADYGDDIDGTMTPTERMLSYINANGEAMPLTDDTGMTTVSNLDQGLYIVGETSQPASVDDGKTPTLSRATAPFLMPIPMTNITTINGEAPGTIWQYDLVAYPKNEQIVIRKDIIATGNDAADAQANNGLTQKTDKQIGEYVDFLLTLDVPVLQPQTNGTPNTNRKYVISDTMTDGLTLDSVEADNFTVTLGTGDYKADGNATLVHGTDYTVVHDTKNNGFVLTMTKEGLKKFDVLTRDSKLYIKYSARLNSLAADPSDAIKEEGNHYNLKYGTSVTKDVDISSNKDVKTYTYEVNIKKTFTSKVADMSAVTFKVDKIIPAVNDQSEETKEAVTFIKESTGEYHVYDNKETVIAENKSAEVHVTPEGGLSLKGLDDGTYEISEVRTIGGYNLLREPIRLTINSNKPEDGKIATSTIFDGKNEINVGSGLDSGCINFEIVNNESINALHTGGQGVNNIIYAIGASLIVISGIGLVVAKHKKDGDK